MKIYSTLLLTIFGFATSSFSQIGWSPHIISPSAIAFTDNPIEVITFDIENDGDIDIVTGSFEDGKVAWYENDGQQNFTEHIITTNASGVTKLDMVDMEGDGDIDLLSDASIDDRLYWYENDGQGSFSSHVIYSNDDFILVEDNWASYCIYANDIDSDGDMDAVHAGWSDPVIRWHENDGSNTNFTSHVIDTVGERCQVVARDLDNDDDVDIVATCQYPSLVIWYENDGNQNFFRHNIWEGDTEPRIIKVIDLDKDGDIDIVAAHYGDNTTWYENDGQKNFTAHRIPNSPTSSTIHVVDVDNDDDWDIVTGDPNNNWANSKFGWLENDGDQNFDYHNITYNIDWPSSVWADDIDGDGDIDVFFSSLFDDKVAWYESNLNDNPSGVEDSEAVPVQFSLNQNFPNPFNPTTTIEFSIEKSALVRLTIYDLTGREVTKLLDKKMSAGYYSQVFDAANLASGVYLYQLKAGAFVETQKMILLR